MTKKATPVVDPVPDASVPGDGGKQDANSKPNVIAVSSDKAILAEPEGAGIEQALVAKALPLFDPASMGEPGALPVGDAAMPRRLNKDGTQRKTKYATPEDAAEAKAGRSHHKKKPESGSAVVIPAQLFQLGAESIVGALDMLRSLLSSGTCPAAPEDVRNNCIKAWIRYMEETGKEPPAWVMVLLISGAYVLPALDTPAAQSKVDRFVNWIKSKWVLKFGSH